MSPFALFRISVIAPIVLSIAGTAYAFLAESSFSQDWKDVLAWNGNGEMISHSLGDASAAEWAFMLFAGVIIVVAVVNQILFFFYWKHSRVIFLITWILSYPAILLCGLNVFTPVEYMLYDLAAFISGVSLALAFYSPVARRFTENPNAGTSAGLESMT
jgi:hypothetical protein